MALIQERVELARNGTNDHVAVEGISASASPPNRKA